MQVYLLHHGEPSATSFDPFSVPLSTVGREQAQRLAQQCLDWDIEFLSASTMARAEETADVISKVMPQIERWDLTDLEDTNIDDLYGEPVPGPHLHTWTSVQQQKALKETWNRVTAALARILVFAESRQYERIAILGHQSTLSLILYGWLGLDWRNSETTPLALDYGATGRVTLGDKPIIDWINRIP